MLSPHFAFKWSSEICMCRACVMQCRVLRSASNKFAPVGAETWENVYRRHACAQRPLFWMHSTVSCCNFNWLFSWLSLITVKRDLLPIKLWSAMLFAERVDYRSICSSWSLPFTVCFSSHRIWANAHNIIMQLADRKWMRIGQAPKASRIVQLNIAMILLQYCNNIIAIDYGKVLKWFLRKASFNLVV